MARSTITTVVRCAVRRTNIEEAETEVGVVIATLEHGGETHRFQVVLTYPNGKTSMLLEKCGGRDYVMSEFDSWSKILA